MRAGGITFQKNWLREKNNKEVGLARKTGRSISVKCSLPCFPPTLWASEVGLERVVTFAIIQSTPRVSMRQKGRSAAIQRGCRRGLDVQKFLPVNSANVPLQKKMTKMGGGWGARTIRPGTRLVREETSLSPTRKLNLHIGSHGRNRFLTRNWSRLLSCPSQADGPKLYLERVIEWGGISAGRRTKTDPNNPQLLNTSSSGRDRVRGQSNPRLCG